MCEHIRPIETKTKFVILMHPKEFKKVKNNTGHFTHKSLRNSELFVGIDFSEHRRINEIIASHESYILFPSKDSLILNEKKPSKSAKPLAIFLIDSTWGCTKKMFTVSKNLQTLKHMSFHTLRKSIYEIKVQPQEEYLSTIESTQIVLELLKQQKVETITKDALEHFLDPFVAMIAYQKELIANPKSHAVRFRRERKSSI